MKVIDEIQRLSEQIKQTDGVFLHLIDTATFIDKVQFTIDTPPQKPYVGIHDTTSRPIGGLNSLYGRLLTGTCDISKNPVAITFGARKSFLPKARMIVRSSKMPVMASHVLCLRDSLFPRSAAIVSSVEVTFDITATSIPEIHRQLYTVARSVNRPYPTTIYVGAQTSAWQMRIYAKTGPVTRLEFVLRSAYLRDNAITHAQELAKIRGLPLLSKVWFRQVDPDKLNKQILRAEKHGVNAGLVRQNIRYYALQRMEKRLQYALRDTGITISNSSSLTKKLQTMQRRLIW